MSLRGVVETVLQPGVDPIDPPALRMLSRFKSTDRLCCAGVTRCEVRHDERIRLARSILSASRFLKLPSRTDRCPMLNDCVNPCARKD